jgi:CubicO group peptidase (beta-lactamase class C family)
MTNLPDTWPTPLAAHRVLHAAVVAHVFPGGVAEVGTSRGVSWGQAVGRLTYDDDAPPTTPETLFDLASLTKVIATTSVAMSLFDAGTLDIDAAVGRLVPDWRGADRPDVRVRDLLEHCSGLPAWAPLYRASSGRGAFARAIAATPLAYQTRSRSLYSDLGFILLGFALEAAAGLTLDVQLARILARVKSPDGPPALVFNPPASWRPRIAPTRIDDWRDRLLVGEVDDANAWALGGVAAHAGLFGTARGVGAFARQVLRDHRAADDAPSGLVRRATLVRFLARSTVPGSSRALGWDTMLPTSSCGTKMSPSAFGHTGFTGTSLWIDPPRDVYAVLLTNRVYPDGGSDDAMRATRRAWHDAVMEGGARDAESA